VKEIATERILNPWLLIDPIFRLHPLSTVERFMSNMATKHLRNAIIDNFSEKKGNTGSMKEFMLAEGVTHEGISEEAANLLSAV